MTLAPSTRLGPYEIVAPLGAGGMGEVYRARDTRLGREVAVKLVLAGAAHDPDRLHRFEQEARATSALNHPNLLTVHDFGSHEGQPYLVTELLEGRTLRELLAAEERIPLRIAVDIGVQIARGLAAAHEKGIVHRDLKPENLFLTGDGRVKILDFGLAKLIEHDVASIANATTLAGGAPLPAATASGTILGTAGYMAPEQVRAERVDARADLFSLGCVLYELFGAKRAFGGDTAIESLNAILKEEPRPLSELRADLPAALARLVERCLEKSPARRFQGATDLAWALESAGAGGSGIEAAAGVPSPPAARRARWTLAAAAILVAGGVAGWLLARAFGADPVERTPEWRGELMVGGSRLAYGPRVSPDGSTVAFMLLVDGQSQVAVMRPGETRWTQLTSERGRGPALSLAWSPDGRLIYLHRAVPSAIYSVPALGGEERLVLADAGSPAALPDGSLVVERVSANNTARLVRFHPRDAREEEVGPEFQALTSVGPSGRLSVFADGREAVYIAQRRADTEARAPSLWAIDIATGALRDLSPGLDLSGAEGGIVAPALGIDRARDEVLLDVRHGDLHVLSAIPRAGGAPRSLVQLTSPPWYVDAGVDGAVYADQIAVSGSLLRFGVEGGAPAHVARFAGTPGGFATSPLELPGRGVLFTTVQSGRATLLLASPRGVVPFVEISEETSGPAARLGDRVAFLVGPAAARQIALATLDGRIVRRLPVPGAGQPTAFAAFGDGRRLLYGLQASLLELDTESGATRELAQGDSGTIDPATGELLVKGFAGEGSVIRRFGPGGELREEQARNPEIFDESFSAEAVDRRGRLLATVGPPESWFLEIGLSTPADRRLRAIPVEFDGDLFAPSWGADGSVLAVGWEYSTSVWRFVPEDGSRAGAER